MIEHYLTIAGKSDSFLKEKGSKFIGIAVPVKSENDVDEAMALIKKEYYDARHHCYAFRLKPDMSIYRYSDDGEPNNSAGPPIYGQIQSKEITNVLVVVVRYFGGTKLGVGGLISAYKEAAKLALDSASIIQVGIKKRFKIQFKYDQTASALRILDQTNIIHQEFTNICIVEFEVKPSLSPKILSALGLAGIDYKEV